MFSVNQKDSELQKYKIFQNYHVTSSINNKANVDRNKVFIPFRPVFEMEVLISLYLVNKNYEDIKPLTSKLLDIEDLMVVFGIEKGTIYHDIVDRFYILLNRLKPLSLNERDHHDRRRYGNVNAYSKSRIPAFFAIDRIKVKFLMLKRLLDQLKKNDYDLTIFPKYYKVDVPTLETILFKEYYARTMEYFNIVTPQKEFVENKRPTLRGIDTSKLELMCGYVSQTDLHSGINFMMRGIKASLFVSEVIFRHLDIPNPFEHRDGHMINVADTILDNAFIPELIPAISNAIANKNVGQLNDLHQAFNFLMARVINGLNNAIDIASNKQISLGEEQILYYTGNVLNL